MACFLKFKDEDEVIRMANNIEYGLGGAVWTRRHQQGVPRGEGCRDRAHVGEQLQQTCLPMRRSAGTRSRVSAGDAQDDAGALHQKKNIFISLSEKKVGMY